MVEEIEKIKIDDEEFIVGRMIQRMGGQSVTCCLSNCEWCKDNMCYCGELHICRVSGEGLPSCMSYVGIDLS